MVGTGNQSAVGGGDVRPAAGRAPSPRHLTAKLRRLSLPVLAASVLLGVVPLLFCGWLVHHSAHMRIFTDISLLPFNNVGLVLGTGRLNSYNGLPNLHFSHRLKAAAELYRAGKVKHLILSGNNDRHGYDEPADMRAGLLALGVPEDAMTLDPSGFRTLDSVVRVRDVYGQRKYTIITDEFHCYRTIFLARNHGLDVVAFPSEEVELRWSLRSRLRERFADVKACLDLYVLHTRPREVSEPVVLPIPGN